MIPRRSWPTVGREVIERGGDSTGESWEDWEDIFKWSRNVVSCSRSINRCALTRSTLLTSCMYAPDCKAKAKYEAIDIYEG